MMSELSRGIPNLLYERMASVRDEVRTRYRTWIAISWSSLLFTAILLVGLCIYVRRAVILPFKALLHGSRLVAAGRFDYRIEIDSQDELSELAAASTWGPRVFYASSVASMIKYASDREKSFATSNWRALDFWQPASPMKSTIRSLRSHGAPKHLNRDCTICCIRMLPPQKATIPMIPKSFGPTFEESKTRPFDAKGSPSDCSIFLG